MRRAVPWLIALLGAALAVAGVIVFAAANRGPVDVGWSSYAPLTRDVGEHRSIVTFSDGVTVLWTRQHLLGAGLVVAGLLVLAGVGGWLLGRRAGRRGGLRA